MAFTHPTRVRVPVTERRGKIISFDKEFNQPCWRSWIARTPSKREVAGSSPAQGILVL